MHRTGTPEDALCIGVLATQVFLDTYATEGMRPDLAREVLGGYSTNAFRSRLADPATSFVLAEARQHLVGFVEDTRGRACPVASCTSRVELVRLYVQRPSHRRGIGRGLLARAAAVAHEDGAAALWLTVWADNRDALAFYRAAGCEDVGSFEHVIEGRVYVNRVLVLRSRS